MPEAHIISLQYAWVFHPAQIMTIRAGTQHIQFSLLGFKVIIKAEKTSLALSLKIPPPINWNQALDLLEESLGELKGRKIVEILRTTDDRRGVIFSINQQTDYALTNPFHVICELFHHRWMIPEIPYLDGYRFQQSEHFFRQAQYPILHRPSTEITLH